MTFLAALLALPAALSCPQATPPAQIPSQALTLSNAPANVVELTLEQAIETALANDLEVEQFEIASEIAQFNFEGSWGAFDPVWSANADYTRSANYPVAVTSNNVFTVEGESVDLGTGLHFPTTTGGGFDVTIDQFSNLDPNGSPARTYRDQLALSFNQPLLRGGGSAYATSTQHELDLRSKKQNERVRQARQNVIQSVVIAYWDLVASIEQLQVAEETLSLGREQQTQNERRLAAGVGTEVEVLQAQANVAERVGERLLRETAVKGAADRLKGILYPGTDVATWERDIHPVTPLPQADASLIPDWQGSLLIALDSRSELRQQRLEIDATEEQLVRARSETKPQLDFVAAASGHGLDDNYSDAFDGALSFDGKRYLAGLSFSFPVGNRFARNAELAARAGLRSARIAYDQLESQVVAEVRDTTRLSQYSAEAVHAAEVTRDLARRQLEAEQARYREGLSTNFQVLEFQQKLAESLYSYTLARANFAKAMTALYGAQGQLGERKGR
jgi:outer membrane protein TolC